MAAPPAVHTYCTLRRGTVSLADGRISREILDVELQRHNFKFTFVSTKKSCPAEGRYSYDIGTHTNFHPMVWLEYVVGDPNVEGSKSCYTLCRSQHCWFSIISGDDFAQLAINIGLEEIQRDIMDRLAYFGRKERPVDIAEHGVPKPTSSTNARRFHLAVLDVAGNQWTQGGRYISVPLVIRSGSDTAAKFDGHMGTVTETLSKDAVASAHAMLLSEAFQYGERARAQPVAPTPTLVESAPSEAGANSDLQDFLNNISCSTLLNEPIHVFGDSQASATPGTMDAPIQSWDQATWPNVVPSVRPAEVEYSHDGKVPCDGTCEIRCFEHRIEKPFMHVDYVCEMTGEPTYTWRFDAPTRIYEVIYPEGKYDGALTIERKTRATINDGHPDVRCLRIELKARIETSLKDTYILASYTLVLKRTAYA